MLQIIDRCIDLVQRIAMRHQLIQLEFPLAVPANEDRKVAVRLAVAAAEFAIGRGAFPPR